MQLTHLQCLLSCCCIGVGCNLYLMTQNLALQPLTVSHHHQWEPQASQRHYLLLIPRVQFLPSKAVIHVTTKYVGHPSVRVSSRRSVSRGCSYHKLLYQTEYSSAREHKHRAGQMAWVIMVGNRKERWGRTLKNGQLPKTGMITCAISSPLLYWIECIISRS